MRDREGVMTQQVKKMDKIYRIDKIKAEQRDQVCS